MEYLHWAKVHARVRYELTDSGVPPLKRHDFGIGPADISFEVEGTYGDPALIDAVARRYGVSSDGIVPVPGTSSANFVALAVACGRGGTLLIEHPVYDPIERVAAFLGIEAIRLPRHSSRVFGVDLERVESGLRQGARAVVLTNLHNPSGQPLSREAVTQVAEACATAGATLVVDEVYLDSVAITGNGPLWTAASIADNVIATSSLTKVYGLGGLRIGWLLTSPELARRARTVMNLLSVVNSAPSSSLATYAFARIGQLESRYRKVHAQGQSVYRAWLEEQRDLIGYPNHGAIFECLRLPEGVSSMQLHDLLVTEYDTQVVPGRFFHLDDHIRIGLTLPPDDLAEALSRITEAADRLARGQV